MFRVRRCSVFLLFALLPTLTLAWGSQGHRQVGAIADQLIAGSNAAKWVSAILGGLRLQSASVWADCAKAVRIASDQTFVYQANPQRSECAVFAGTEEARRFERFVARNWKQCGSAHGSEYCANQYHYADVSSLHDRYATAYVGTSDHDVVHAVTAAIAVLRGQKPDIPFDIADKREALMLLAHYVGDIHQPLHVVALYLDADGQVVNPEIGGYKLGHDTAGGNNLYDGKQSLHAEWDAVPLDLQASGEPSMLLLRLARQTPITAGDPLDWPSAWATDSIRAGRMAFAGLRFKMRPGAGSDLENSPEKWDVIGIDAAYIQRADQLKMRQLAKAGARLAQILKAIWPNAAVARSN